MCFCRTNVGGRAYFCRNKHIIIKNGLKIAEICIFSTFIYGISYLLEKMLLSAEMLNMLNHVGDLVWKICFFLQKCWICWIMLEGLFGKCASFCWLCWICWMFLEPIGSFAYRFKKHSTYSTFLQKAAHFSNKISNMIQHIQHFCNFELILYKKCFFLQKCWISWICWMCLGLTSSIACRSQKPSTYSTFLQ